MATTRPVMFKLTQPVERALLRVLHEIEVERGRRATWDEALRKLLADAGKPVEDDVER
jgi:hypothetical protein